MNLRFNVLGIEVARVELDIVEMSPSAKNLTSNEPPTLLDRGVKKMSDFWVRRMLKG